jgi:pimeloyl-ACP methyl ester carboxylesterase
MSFITINGCSYYYETSGNNNNRETLVFSHGLLWSSKMFWKQIEYFKSRYQILVYDHRGQGKTSVTNRGYDMDQLTDDVIHLIEHLNPGKIHFAGLSMGGFVGMRLAARRPDLLSSLILMETSAQKETKKFKYSVLTAAVNLFGVKAVTTPVLNIMFGKKFLEDKKRAEEKKEWRDELWKNKKTVVRAVKGILYRKGIESELKNIKCPVLILEGTQDKAATPAMAEFIHNNIAHSEIHYIEGGGHTSSIEEPDQVNFLINRFLESIQ